MSEENKNIKIEVEAAPTGQVAPTEPANDKQEPATGKKPKEEPAKPQAKPSDEPTLKEAIQQQAREDEQALTPSLTLKKIIGGDFLTAALIRRQIGLILIVVAFTIVYISNRYSCQKNLLEIDRLNKELQDAKYKALSSSSMLTEKCRESHVLDMLKANKDSVLHIADQPPYIINTPEK